jgi:hypothetical protein
MRRLLAVSLFAGSLAFAHAAVAQVVWDMPNIIEKKGHLDNSVVRRLDVWPRLDPGAIICRTEADLVRLAAFRRGEPGDRPNCVAIHYPTAIDIEKRDGPGRTQVSLKDQAGVDGWTDAWLPDRALPVGGKGITIK